MALSKQRGVTMLEMAVVLAILLIVSATSFISLQPAMRDVHVSSAYTTTLETMRQARQWSVDNRKTYLLTFNPVGTPAGTNRIQIQRVDAGVVGPVVTNVALATDVQFLAQAGVPNTTSTTPDGMGTGTLAIEFDIGVGGTANQIYFFPDGSARDINNNTNNGVVYIARPGDLYSSRAITLFGAAGRIRGWRLYRNAGSGLAYWSQQ